MVDAHAERAPRLVAGGSLGELLGGSLVIGLALLGLLQIHPAVMAALAMIVASATSIFEGVAIASRRSEEAPSSREEARRQEIGTTSAEFTGGAAGAVLGMLALVGVAPEVTLAVAAVLLGGARLAGGGGSVPTAKSQAALGTAIILLGVLALVRIAPLPSIHFALLALGVSGIVSGVFVRTTRGRLSPR